MYDDMMLNLRDNRSALDRYIHPRRINDNTPWGWVRSIALDDIGASSLSSRTFGSCANPRPNSPPHTTRDTEDLNSENIKTLKTNSRTN